MRGRLLVALAILWLGSGPPAAADGLSFSFRPPGLPAMLAESEQDRAKGAVRAGEIQPFPNILGSVQNQFHGRLSDAKLVKQGDGWIYRVKWLTPDSNVLAITVDARTGRVLGVSGRGADAARKR